MHLALQTVPLSDQDEALPLRKLHQVVQLESHLELVTEWIVVVWGAHRKPLEERLHLVDETAGKMRAALTTGIAEIEIRQHEVGQQVELSVDMGRQTLEEIGHRLAGGGGQGRGRRGAGVLALLLSDAGDVHLHQFAEGWSASHLLLLLISNVCCESWYAWSLVWRGQHLDCAVQMTSAELRLAQK